MTNTNKVEMNDEMLEQVNGGGITDSLCKWMSNSEGCKRLLKAIAKVEEITDYISYRAHA